jgi:hypothetical protein
MKVFCAAFFQWGMQARASMVTKLTKVSGKQMDFL